MSNYLNPKLVILQSSHNTDQFFFLVLIDLPADPETFPDPSALLPQLIDGELIFETQDYELPDKTNEPTITYLLPPYMIMAPEGSGVPGISKIVFKSRDRKKKGDVSGIKTHSLPFKGNGSNPAMAPAEAEYYDCSGRAFVIQSDTNPETYFAGTLVDFPAEQIPGTPLTALTYLEIPIVPGSNSSLTCVVCSTTPASYNQEAGTATYTHIFVEGQPTALQGIFLGDGTDLYSTAFQPNESDSFER